MDLVLEGRGLVLEVGALAPAPGLTYMVEFLGQLLLLDFLGSDCCFVLLDHFIDSVLALFILIHFLF